MKARTRLFALLGLAVGLTLSQVVSSSPAQAQSAGYLWMYPLLNGKPNYAAACLLDAGSGFPVDNLTTSWDGGCGALSAQSCYQLQCPAAVYVEATSAATLKDYASESISAGQVWQRCFSAAPTIAVDPKSGNAVCTLLPMTQN